MTYPGTHQSVEGQEEEILAVEERKFRHAKILHIKVIIGNSGTWS